MITHEEKWMDQIPPMWVFYFMLGGTGWFVILGVSWVAGTMISDPPKHLGIVALGGLVFAGTIWMLGLVRAYWNTNQPLALLSLLWPPVVGNLLGVWLWSLLGWRWLHPATIGVGLFLLIPVWRESKEHVDS